MVSHFGECGVGAEPKKTLVLSANKFHMIVVHDSVALLIFFWTAVFVSPPMVNVES